MKSSIKSYVVQALEQLNAQLYKECVNHLLKKKNYTRKDIDISNVNLYLSFLEKSLNNPFNRLNSLSKFVEDDSTMMLEPVYPFCYLKEKVRKQIRGISIVAITLATGLNDADLDFLYQDFSTENHAPE